jgi:hypothetical protein
MDADRRNKRSGEKASLDWNPRDYPHFTWHVKDLFETYIDEQAKNCLSKCMDELNCIQLIYWEMTSKKYVKTLLF